MPSVVEIATRLRTWLINIKFEIVTDYKYEVRYDKSRAINIKYAVGDIIS